MAQRLGIHPNTLRWYEAAAYLPPVPRTPGGHRLYSAPLVRLARIVRTSQPLLRLNGPIRFRAMEFLRACKGECPAATTTSLATLDALETVLRQEYRLALDALQALERFRRGTTRAQQQQPARPEPLRYIGTAAARTGLTRDRIINWERDGLCRYPRTPTGGYRLFGAEEVDRLLVIRSCRTAGYSITAIRRLLNAIDREGEAGAELDSIRTLTSVANTPTTYETQLFPVFPTDTLPETLEQLLELVGTLRTIVTGLS